MAEAGLNAKVLDIGTGAVCDLLPDDYDPASGMVGLRADIDGLPIQDGKNVAYRSRFDGCCHACGHDVHTTVVLGPAWCWPGCGRRGSCNAASG